MKSMQIEIKIEKLKKKLGPNQALKDITTDFDHGLMHGLIGPEGAGKTTLFRHIVKLLTADSGKIDYFKNKQKVDLDEIRAKIAYMPQQQSLYSDLSIDEHIMFFKEMYNLNEEEFHKKREQLYEITRLGKFSDRPAGKLSGGMYKKLGLMCSLMSSPDVLLLDEPTNGVDPISRREFWDLLYHLREEKILIIVATSYMDEAERCSKVHLLNEGSLIGSGEPKVLLEENQVNSFNDYFMKVQKAFSSEGIHG